MPPQESTPINPPQIPSAPDQMPAGPAMSPKGGKKKLLIILAVIVALILAGGAYALFGMSDKAEAPQQSEQQDTEQTSTEEEAAVGCTEGTTEFAGDNIGVHFCYPASWGNASLEPAREESMGHLTKGSQKVIKFSGNATVVAGLMSKDWTHDEMMGHDGIPDPGHKSLADAKRAKEYLKASYVYTDTDAQFAYINSCMEFCSDDKPLTRLFWTVIIPGNETYEVIEFYQDGDVLGSEFEDKDFGGVSYEKVEAADLTTKFPKTDSRFVILQQVIESVRK